MIDMKNDLSNVPSVFQVKERHFKEGKKNEGKSCALALSLKEGGLSDVWVYRIKDKAWAEFDYGGFSYRGYFEDGVSDRIWEFDNELPVFPFTLRLNLERRVSQEKVRSLPESEVIEVALRHALCLLGQPADLHPDFPFAPDPLPGIEYIFDNCERDEVESFIEDGKGWIKFDLAGSLMLVFDKHPIDPTDSRNGHGTLYRNLYSQNIPWDALDDFIRSNCIRSPKGIPVEVVRHLLDNVNNCGWKWDQ